MIAWSKKNSSAVDPVAAAAATAGMLNQIQISRPHLIESLPDISIPLFSVSLSLSGSAESANAAAENKDREVIIAMVTKAVTAITQRLTSLSTFDGTDSKVRAHEYACRVGGRFATLVLARSGGVAHLLSETQTSVF